MMRKRLFLCFLLMVFSSFPVVAQTPTTQGKEFWASFMRNGYNTTTGSYNHFTLIASAKHACTVTVTNPNTGWTNQFEVSNNGVSTFYVDRNQGYNDQMGGVASKGLYITSTDTISLYIANEAENSYDAANVLPASTLGSRYMIQSYKALGDQSSHYGDSRASFMVLATENNTEVQITPSCLTYDNHPAGQPYSITLNRGECYHVLNKNAGSTTNVDGDFSGTMVVSADDKPIAVFNGNSITSVPGGLSTGYDHIFEQAMPTDYWGKRFVVTSTRCPAYMNLQPDQIKVTALNDNTTVTRNGAELFTLNAGESNFFTMDLVSDPCTYLEADNPIAVFLYQHSHGDGSPAYGDPSMVWISPVEQTVFEVTFSTFAVQQVEVHYVNVVCYSENVSEMTLDGQDISSNFSPVPGAPEFSYTRYQVDHRAHTLRCPGGFVAHVYGIGQAEGYAYSVGSSAKQLTKQLYVNDILSTQLPDGYTTCQNEEVTFRVETNYDYDHVEWDFGDNTYGEGAEVKHAYPIAVDYNVQSVVYRSFEKEVQPFDTLNVTIHVDAYNSMCVHETTCSDTYFFRGVYYQVPCDTSVILPSDVGCDTLCHLQIDPGQEVTHTFPPVSVCASYNWFGEIIVSEGLNHLEHRVPNATPEGCDSLYIQDVTIGYPPEHPERYLSSCSACYWHEVLCSETNDYFHEFITDEGCVYDSIMHFTLLSNGDMPMDTVTTCDSYTWHEGYVIQEYGTHIYYDTIVGSDGCESYLSLLLTLYETPPFDSILGRDNVAVATNFWPGKYVYYLNDSTGLDVESVHWELIDAPNWVIEPRGASCVIKTLEMGSGMLHAWTSGNGSCDKEVFKAINCSGFAVDEYDAPLFEVFPNPAKDAVFVKGEGIEGIAIFNMVGVRVKELEANGSDLVEVDLDGLPSALYLVQVRTKQYNKTQLFSVIR